MTEDEQKIHGAFPGFRAPSVPPHRKPALSYRNVLTSSFNVSTYPITLQGQRQAIVNTSNMCQGATCTSCGKFLTRELIYLLC
jgi:hypothetical protein